MPEHPSRRLPLHGSGCLGLPPRLFWRSISPPGGSRYCRCMAKKPVPPTLPRFVIPQWLHRNTMANAMGSRNLDSRSSRPIRKRGSRATNYRCKLCSVAAEGTTGSEDGRLAKSSGHGRACMGGWTVVCKSRGVIQFGSLAQESACEKGHQKPEQGNGFHHAASTMGIPGFDYRQWDGVCERWTAESDLQKYGWRSAAYLRSTLIGPVGLH